MQIALFFNTRDSRPPSLLLNVLHLFSIYTVFHALSLQICNAAQMCNSARYSNGSRFETNLNTVLNNLVQHTSSSGGYSTSETGQVPNRIYGLLQCRGDASREECYSCSQDAKTNILGLCPNAAGGRTLMDKCFLRYENYSFIGQLDTDPQIVYRVDDATDPDTLLVSVRGQFSYLINNASSSEKRFATASTRYYYSETYDDVNSLVQCWQDISLDDCKSCLTKAVSLFLQLTHGSKLGGVCFMGSCMTRYEVYSFFGKTPSPPTALPPASAEAPTPTVLSRPTASTSKKSSKRTALVGGIVVGSLVVLLVGVAVFAKPRKLKAAMVGLGRPIALGGLEMEEDTLIGEDRLTIFSLETLKNATENFHNDNKLGEGGFGPVYKGTLIDRKEIAVKKLSLKSVQGKQEFLNEVNLVKLQHKNLVQIFGCCAEGSERLLVYEFLPNNSLDKLLFDPLLRKQLDWETRFNIILGIVRGLVYLHEDSRQRIIHRDIKASNILLDERMNPKIADFGLARLFVDDESHVSTRVAGTFGYMAPEYVSRGQLTPKADVYSFGVLLLEIVCGRKNTDLKLHAENQILIELVWRSFESRHAVDLIDAKILEDHGEEEGMRCIHVGLLCTQGDASLRPNMSTVYTMLSNPAMTNMPHPTKPAIVNITSDEMRSRIVNVCSRIPSITHLEGR